MVTVSVPEYYGLRGWTPEGVPTKETLDRLGLDATHTASPAE